MVTGHSLAPNDFDKYITYGIYILQELDDNGLRQITDADIEEVGLGNLVYGANGHDLVVDDIKVKHRSKRGKIKPYGRRYWVNSDSVRRVCRNSILMVPYMYYEGPTVNGGVAKWRCNTLKLRQIIQEGWLQEYFDCFTSEKCKTWVITAVKHLYYAHRMTHNIGDMGFTEFCLNLCSGHNHLFENPYYIKDVEKGTVESCDDIPDADIELQKSISIKKQLERIGGELW